MILFCITLLLSHVVYTADVHDLARCVAEHDKREREHALQVPTHHAGMTMTGSHRTDLSRYSREQLIQYRATIADDKNNEYQRWRKEDQQVEMPIQALFCGIASPALLGSIAAALSGIEPLIGAAGGVGLGFCCVPLCGFVFDHFTHWHSPDLSRFYREIKEVNEEIAARDSRATEQEKEKAE